MVRLVDSWCSIKRDPSRDPLKIPFEIVSRLDAYLSAVVQLQHSQGGWHDEALLLVVWRRNALEHAKSAQRLLALWRLVRQHASNGSPEDLARRPVVVRAVVRVNVASFAQEVQVLHCGGREETRRSIRKQVSLGRFMRMARRLKELKLLELERNY